MHDSIRAAAVATLLLVGPVFGQSITAAVVRNATLTCWLDAQEAKTTVPAGTLTVGGYIAAAPGPSGRVEASFSCLAYGNGSYLFSSASFWCSAQGPGEAKASVGPIEWRVLLSQPVAATVTLSLEAHAQVVPGQTAPHYAVDIGDDGTVEFGTGSAFQTHVLLGPVPLPVRITGAATLQGTGTHGVAVAMLVAPSTRIEPAGPGCAEPQLALFSNLDGHLGVALWAPWQDAAIAVFGLAAQPSTIGVAAGVPCVLVPSPDVLVLLQPNQWLTLPLPPAVRPVTLWAQGVGVSLSPSLQLVTSPAYRVIAP